VLADIAGTKVDRQLISDWCAWLATSASPKTVRLRRYQLASLSVTGPLADQTEDTLVAYLGARGRSPNTRKSMQAAFRSFYGWAHRTGRVDVDPTVGLRPVRASPGVPKPLPDDAYQQAYGRADRQTRAMLALGYHAGLRLSEIAQVHGDDVRGDRLVVHGKGAKDRVVPINASLAPHLKEFTGWLFPSPARPGEHVSPDYVDARVKAVLPQGHSTHSLRHGFATRVYAATKDIMVVRQLLGHVSVSTTMVYVASDDDAALAAVRAVA
jgi:integrase